MEQAFAISVLTLDGAALIAQATAANPIVYVGALSSATAATSATDLATRGKDWYTGKTGTIAAVSATANAARIVARWGRSGSAQVAKTLAVTARLASQTDSQAVVVTALSDPDSTVILPGATDTASAVSIPFSVAINAADSVEVTPGAAASVADLERFVSMYRAGDPTVGEAQTIRGDKAFTGNVTVGGRVDTPVIQHPGGVAITALDGADSRAVTLWPRGLVTFSQDGLAGEAILTTEDWAVTDDVHMLSGVNAVEDNQGMIGSAEQVNSISYDESALSDGAVLTSSMRVRYGGTYSIPGSIYAQLSVNYAKTGGIGSALIKGMVGIKSFTFDGSKFTVEAPVEATNLPDGHIPTPSINASNSCEVAVGGIILLFINTPSTGPSMYNVGDVVNGSACRAGGFAAGNNYAADIYPSGHAFPSGYKFKMLSESPVYDTGAEKYAMALAMRIE